MPADHRTKPQDKPNTTPLTPGEKSSNGNTPRDARNDKSRQSQNRKELGVGEDHKTKDMEEKNRGTFP
jgi:hypothetical protein